VLQVLRRIHLVLRGLRNDVVVDVIGQVEEEHRRDLKAATEGIQHTGGNVALGVAALQRLGAIDVDL